MTVTRLAKNRYLVRQQINGKDSLRSPGKEQT
jgi:hypothetical protein